VTINRLNIGIAPARDLNILKPNRKVTLFVVINYLIIPSYTRLPEIVILMYGTQFYDFLYQENYFENMNL